MEIVDAGCRILGEVGRVRGAMVTGSGRDGGRWEDEQMRVPDRCRWWLLGRG